ncbi:hypothetical protein SETIT_8G173000v2 [Setaria italica]|uniref:Uncharacterized protein n=1 Tax=Setaria italica TaxID=4555 RepID=A0A368S8Q9_SETIT|nr:hypothetical protein SETIT_8G173000v2 [Setaria italica]
MEACWHLGQLLNAVLHAHCGKVPRASGVPSDDARPLPAAAKIPPRAVCSVTMRASVLAAHSARGSAWSEVKTKTRSATVLGADQTTWFFILPGCA